MEASLAACILAALLASGSCLQCEVCTELGTSCSGTVQTCSAGLDSCGITLIEQTLAGMKQQVIAKACISSDRCNLGPLTMNFGNGVTMKQGIACCVGDACRTTTVTGTSPHLCLSPIPGTSCCLEPAPRAPADPKPNGRRCPACVAVLSAQCNEGIIDCTGAETRCIEIAGTTTIGGTTTSMTMKGCASEDLCANTTEASESFAGISTDLTFKCKASGTARGPVGLLIPALAGLLLMQLLS